MDEKPQQKSDKRGLSASAIREKACPDREKAAARQGVGRRVSSWDLTSVLGFVSCFAMGSRLRAGWKTPTRRIPSMRGYPVADQKDAGNAGFLADLPQKGGETFILPNFAETAVLLWPGHCKTKGFWPFPGNMAM